MHAFMVEAPPGHDDCSRGRPGDLSVRARVCSPSFLFCRRPRVDPRSRQGSVPPPPAPGRPLPRQHGGRPVDNGAGAPPPWRRREARRVRALRTPSGGRRLPRPRRRLRPPPGNPAAGTRRAAAADGRLPLHLRPHPRAAVAAVPVAAALPQEVGHALPRLGHPRQDARAAGRRQEGRRRDRRQLRRDPLGARGRGDPAGDRPLAVRSRTAVGSGPPGDPARTLVATAQGHRARDRRGRRARRRPRDRRGAPSRRGVRALPERRHRRRPAQRGLVRPLRDRVHGARQAGRHLPPRGGREAHRGGVRHHACRSSRRPPRPSASSSGRSSPTRRSAGVEGRRRAPTSSSFTTRSGSPTASSTSTLVSDGALRPAQAARQALRDLRPRRPRLADPRRPPAAALHALPLDVRLRPDRDADRARHGARRSCSSSGSGRRSSASTSTQTITTAAGSCCGRRSGSR